MSGSIVFSRCGRNFEKPADKYRRATVLTGSLGAVKERLLSCISIFLIFADITSEGEGLTSALSFGTSAESASCEMESVLPPPPSCKIEGLSSSSARLKLPDPRGVEAFVADLLTFPCVSLAFQYRF